MFIDFHVHTINSFDSLIRPNKIERELKKKNLDGIAITDHNTVISRKTMNEFSKKSLVIIPGIEIKTNWGDVIGLFITDTLNDTDFFSCIDSIKDHDGISVLAHPFRKVRHYPSSVLHSIDVIEIFNARSKKESNRKSGSISQLYHKPGIAGSDAHFYYEIGRGRTEIENIESFPGMIRKTSGKESNYYFSHGLSVITEKIRKIYEI